MADYHLILKSARDVVLTTSSLPSCSSTRSATGQEDADAAEEEEEEEPGQDDAEDNDNDGSTDEGKARSESPTTPSSQATPSSSARMSPSPTPADGEGTFTPASTLAFCWRAMKEVALIWATLVLRSGQSGSLATAALVQRIGERLMELVLACRHKGSVELLANALEITCARCEWS